MTTIGDEATILNAGLVKISTNLSTTTTIAEESIFYAYGGSNEDRGGLSNQGEVGLNIGKLNISIGGAIGDELGINAGIGWGNEKITASVEIDQSFMVSAGLEHDVVKGKYDNTEIAISEGVKFEATGVVVAGAAWLLSGGTNTITFFTVCL